MRVKVPAIFERMAKNIPLKADLIHLFYEGRVMNDDLRFRYAQPNLIIYPKNTKRNYSNTSEILLKEAPSPKPK